MRIWSFHPKYLDSKGLVALWREGLLAKAVLEGNTKGYKSHPQLVRFQLQERPVEAVNAYLYFVLEEARSRKYHFDPAKLKRVVEVPKIKVTDGQLRYEWAHLLSKLKVRDSERFLKLSKASLPEPHPVFTCTQGPVEKWEAVKRDIS
ncbi:MAG TPA: DNA lyase [Synergistaceae bacterium]|jgi:hypothetical protein|nr:DNA lyase [Synergistaceae bacterium]